MFNGYKPVHVKCIQAGLVVTQITVLYLFNVLDPEGVQLRKRNCLK